MTLHRIICIIPRVTKVNNYRMIGVCGVADARNGVVYGTNVIQIRPVSHQICSNNEMFVFCYFSLCIMMGQLWLINSN